jgi:hypothetical protein
MSVWSTDSQRLDLYRDIYLLGLSLHKLLLPDSPKQYLACNNEMVDEEFADGWDEVAIICRWPVVEDDVELPDLHQKQIGKIKKWHLG